RKLKRLYFIIGALQMTRPQVKLRSCCRQTAEVYRSARSCCRQTAEVYRSTRSCCRQTAEVYRLATVATE
ncbi:MAG: hypothetical protein KDA51_08305, partial [Planctomycetales bacterium]|nr:hypothetical protein [Planctomycetales bacterium]